MDVPDVEIVVNYCLPDTISQFYQVIFALGLSGTCAHHMSTIHPQLSGRAGRNGFPAYSDLFVNAKQVKACKDDNLRAYSDHDTATKENCRRHLLLTSLGSSERPSVGTEQCCNQCRQQGVPYKNLELVKRTQTRKRRRTKVREVSKDLLKVLFERLTQEQDTIVSESIGFHMLGAEVVCHSKVITEICSRAKFITSVASIKDIPGLRPQLVSRFYSTCTVIDALSDAPQPTKR